MQKQNIFASVKEISGVGKSLRSQPTQTRHHHLPGTSVPAIIDRHGNRMGSPMIVLLHRWNTFCNTSTNAAHAWTENKEN